MLRMMLKRELYLTLREPLVLMSILLPLLIYSGLGPLFGQAASQVKQAASLTGVSVAVIPGGPGEETLAELIVEGLRSRGVNATLAQGDPLHLLSEHRIVVLLPPGFAENLTRGLNATLVVYARGEPTRLLASLAAPAAAAARVLEALAPQRGPRVNIEAFVALGERVYSIEELQEVSTTAVMLSALSILVIAPAASIASILMGSEREEKMLEVLLALPIRRATIATAKIATSILVASLAAASAAIGLYNMLSFTSPRAATLTKYYTPGAITLYIAALLASAAFAATLTLTLSLFATTIRGAQATSIVVLLLALLPVVTPLTGLSLSPAALLTPFYCVTLAAYQPVLGPIPAIEATLAQTAETLAAAALFTRLLGSELVLTGPEAVKRLVKLHWRGR